MSRAGEEGCRRAAGPLIRERSGARGDAGKEKPAAAHLERAGGHVRLRVGAQRHQRGQRRPGRHQAAAQHRLYELKRLAAHRAADGVAAVARRDRAGRGRGRCRRRSGALRRQREHLIPQLLQHAGDDRGGVALAVALGQRARAGAGARRGGQRAADADGARRGGSRLGGPLPRQQRRLLGAQHLGQQAQRADLPED